MIARYFAYGSNMNPDRVRERGIKFHMAMGARLPGFALVFDKTSRDLPGAGHANMVPAPGREVEGVLYWLCDTEEIRKMDPYEAAPVNYSREVIQVQAQRQDVHAAAPIRDLPAENPVVLSCWTYFANPAVRVPGLLPPRSYLDHLLAGRAFLSADYVRMLERWPCREAL